MPILASMNNYSQKYPPPLVPFLAHGLIYDYSFQMNFQGAHQQISTSKGLLQDLPQSSHHLKVSRMCYMSMDPMTHDYSVCTVMVSFMHSTTKDHPRIG